MSCDRKILQPRIRHRHYCHDMNIVMCDMVYQLLSFVWHKLYSKPNCSTAPASPKFRVTRFQAED